MGKLIIVEAARERAKMHSAFDNKKSRRQQIALRPENPGAPSRTRTCNRRIRSPMLYPLSHGRTKRRYYTANPQRHVGLRDVTTKTNCLPSKCLNENANSRRIKVIGGSHQGVVEFLHSVSCNLRRGIGRGRTSVVQLSLNYL